jgi:hypothetical protein
VTALGVLPVTICFVPLKKCLSVTPRPFTTSTTYDCSARVRVGFLRTLTFAVIVPAGGSRGGGAAVEEEQHDARDEHVDERRGSSICQPSFMIWS